MGCRVFFLFVSFGLLSSASLRSQDFARERLEKSGRHQEWVSYRSGDRTLHAFIVFPEVKEKAPVVIVIHEIFGLTDWARGVCDQLAEAGYIAIAPDFLSGKGPKGGKSSDFPSVDAAREAVSGLKNEEVLADLSLAAGEAKKIPASNGKIAVAGFCWGGSKSFLFATRREDLAAAFVFYGGPPEEKKDLERIRCPVHGFYGGNDARVTATVEKTAAQMKEARKTFDPVVYEGAGHGFLRSGEDPKGKPDDKKAREAAWKRWREILKKI